MDLVNVGAAEGRLAMLTRPFETADVRIIDPFAIERDERIGDGAIFAAVDQHFLAAVGMQQHQVGAGVHQGGVGDLRPDGSALVAPSRSADVDDVVVVLDGLVGRERRRIDIDWIEIEPLFRLLGQTQTGRQDDRQGTESQEPTTR